MAAKQTKTTTRAAAKGRVKAARTRKATMRANAKSAPQQARTARRRMQPDATVAILVDGNPHRPGTIDAGKFYKLTDGATVAEVKAAGIDSGYLREIARRGIISIA